MGNRNKNFDKSTIMWTKTAEYLGLNIWNPWKTGRKCRKISQNGNINCRKSLMPRNLTKWEPKCRKIYQNRNQTTENPQLCYLNCRKSSKVCLKFIKKLYVGLNYKNSNADTPITCILKLPILPKLPWNQSKVKPKVPTNQSSVLQIIKQT